MSESRVFGKFEYPVEKLERMRSQFEIVESFLKRSRPHREHEKRHPGRISKLMSASDRYLQEAEWLMGAIPEGERLFTSKIHDVAFLNSLRLAHVYMKEAVEDQLTILGEETAAIRRKGQAASRKKLSLEVQAIIKRLAKLDLKPAELWKEFDTALDNLSMHPRHDGECVQYEDENGDYREMKYENFKKKIYMARP